MSHSEEVQPTQAQLILLLCLIWEETARQAWGVGDGVGEVEGASRWGEKQNLHAFLTGVLYR